jgi:hypothetical protein
MNNLESGGVEDRALESRVLIAADDESVQSGSLHARADVLVPAIDFFLTWQNTPSAADAA